MLGMSTPQAGKHHDLFEIETLFKEICELVKLAGINLKGLLSNIQTHGLMDLKLY
jgi:hypothetical protein